MNWEHILIALAGLVIAAGIALFWYIRRGSSLDSYEPVAKTEARTAMEPMAAQVGRPAPPSPLEQLPGLGGAAAPPPPAPSSIGIPAPAPMAAAAPAPPPAPRGNPANAPFAWLERLDGSGQRLPIASATATLGRQDGCAVLVKHETISRQHATIAIDASGRATLTDLQSANGVALNGQRITEAALADGDIVQLGALQFRFLEGPRISSVRTPAADAVECSVFAPARAQAGETIVIQVALHGIDLREVAAERAVIFDPDASWRGSGALVVDLERGAQIDVAIDSDGLVIAQPTARLRWNGTVASCAFRAEVPADATRQRFVPSVHLAIRGVPIGHVTFAVQRSELSMPVPPAVAQHAVRYRRAFVSYSSQDRREVLKRLQTLEALRVSFFADVLDLAPGDRWEGQIKREIESCDVFLLFWSQGAQGSAWVRREVEYARELQARSPARLPQILPIVIERTPPPADLAHLHFNSPICTLLSGVEA